MPWPFIHKSKGQTLDKVLIDLDKNGRSLVCPVVARPLTLDRSTIIINSTSLITPWIKETNIINTLVEKTST